jgi:glucokinase
VGGTNIEVGLVGDDNEVLDRRKVNTPDGGPEAVVDAIAELVEDLDDAPDAVGVGIPGGIHEGIILHVPNLENWEDDVALGDMLAERLQVPIALANDADIGLLGEWVAGAARGRRHVLGVWIGTGIGGSLILNGQPYRGSLGAAGELGHVVVRADGALCHCGRRGCVEAYAGRRSMADAVRRITEGGRDSALFDIQEEEGKPRPTSKVWKRAFEEDDDVALQMFDEAVEALGVGIGSIINVLDPELVVVGGGMAEKLGPGLADRIRRATDPWMLHPNPDLAFVAAELGDDSGVIGAASIARAELLTE